MILANIEKVGRLKHHFSHYISLFLNYSNSQW